MKKAFIPVAIVLSSKVILNLLESKGSRNRLYNTWYVLITDGFLHMLI